jgi:predicted dehydrogenase
VVYTNVAELLAKSAVDLVTIAVPVAGHVPLTLQALAAGKHVVCEKPSALDERENLRIIEATRGSDRRVVFLSSRMRWGYAPMAKQMIAAGRLGQVYRVDMRFARRRGRPGIDIIPHARWFLDQRLAGGGVIMDMGQYFLDMVFELLGWPALHSVSATLFRGHGHNLPAEVRYDVEEHCTLLVRTAEGASLSFDLAWIGHHEERMQVSILGTEGGLHIDMAGTPKGEPFVFMHANGTTGEPMDTTTRWRPTISSTAQIYRDVLASAAGSPVSIGTTPEQALVLTRLTTAAQTSARERREVLLAG